jgi:hypothetical protein
MGSFATDVALQIAGGGAQRPLISARISHGPYVPEDLSTRVE